MKKELFEELLESVREGGAILRGEELRDSPVAENEAEWEREIADRIAAYDRGEAEAVSAGLAGRRLGSSLPRRRPQLGGVSSARARAIARAWSSSRSFLGGSKPT